MTTKIVLTVAVLVEFLDSIFVEGRVEKGKRKRGEEKAGAGRVVKSAHKGNRPS